MYGAENTPLAVRWLVYGLLTVVVLLVVGGAAGQLVGALGLPMSLVLFSAVALSALVFKLTHSQLLARALYRDMRDSWACRHYW